jgi:hypothetical protein
MLENATPARSNLTTGVSIESPVLERNKWSYARTNNTSNISVGSDNINGPKISSPYDNYYNNLSGSKAAYFTGVISGSEIDIYNNYFLATINPWAQSTSSYNNGKSINQQVTYNDYLHSDYNALFNNVSSSRPSLKRRIIEMTGSIGYFTFGTGSTKVLYTASLQDSYLSLDSYRLPRYDGVKVSSLTYNNYTPPSSVYVGDTSYGKTAAIDQFVRKIGLFTQIISSSFFPGRNIVALKYLVDESGSLTELNQTTADTTENHWFEVQNTFKLGTNSTVAQFDNQQYSNQKTTDGEKLIFDSGYSYYPSLYYSGSDQKLYFQYTGKSTTLLFKADNINRYITGSTPTPYSASISGSERIIFNVFNQPVQINGSLSPYYYNISTAPSSSNYLPYYSVPQNANMAFSANFGINLQLSAAQSSSYTFSIISGSTTLATQTQVFYATAGNTSTTLIFNVTSSYKDFNPGDQIFFKLSQSGSLPNNATASFAQTGNLTSFTGLQNSLAISPVGINPFATSSASPFISGSDGLNTLYFNGSIAGLRDYLYLPSTSSATLYNSYGVVNNTFSPKVGDTLLIYYNSGNQLQELNIINVNLDNSNYTIKVSPNLVNNLTLGSYTSTTIDKLLLLSKQPDETNLYLSFIKTQGQTSYGFIVPDNLSPDVLSNIDTITKQVKQKLLTTNQGLTINTI